MHTCKKRVEIVMLLFSSVTNFPLLCTIDTRVKVHLMFLFYFWHSKGFFDSIITRIVKYIIILKSLVHSGPRGTNLTKNFQSFFFILLCDKFYQYCLVSPNLHFKMGKAVFCFYLKM